VMLGREGASGVIGDRGSSNGGKWDKWYCSDPAGNDTCGGRLRSGINLSKSDSVRKFWPKYLLAQRSQNEGTLKHKFVGYLKPFVQESLLVVKENVQIDVPRPFVNYFDAPHGILNRLKLVQ
jgi:hypothetical protein